MKCSRWQDDWNWREVAATAGLHHFSKGARGKFKESGSRSSPKNCKLLKSGLVGYGIIRIILLYLINLILSIRLNLRCQRQVQGKLNPDPDHPKICKLLKKWLCIMEMVLYQNTFTTDKNADLDLDHKVLVAIQNGNSLS